MNIADWVRDGARRSPERCAVDGPDGALTYRELDEEVNRVAHFLRAAGIVRGDCVGLWLEKASRGVAVMLGVLRAGAAYVPVDPSNPLQRTVSILRAAGVRGVFTSESRLGLLREADLGGPLWAVPLERTQQAPWSRSAVAAPCWDPSGNADLAYILYTSGSTGIPKGVCLSHDNARAFVEWAVDLLELQDSHELANHAPFHFDLSVFDLYGAFRAGACVHLVPELMAYSPSMLVDFLDERRVSVLYAVPSLLRLLMAEGGLLRHPASGRLQHVVFAGEPFPVADLRRLREGLPQARLYNFYGPTETNVCTAFEVHDLDPQRIHPVPIGGSASGAKLTVVSAEGHPVGVGGEGILVVEGPTVMLGYRGMAPQAGPYSTGDVVRVVAEDCLEYVGRQDDMLKIRGMRIEPGEVEACLLTHESIAEAVVVARGSGLSTRLRACLVAKSAPIGLLEVKSHCAQRVPRHMIPHEIVWLSSIPLTANGKCDRRHLASIDTRNTELRL